MKWEFDTEMVLVQCVPVGRCEFPIPDPHSIDYERDCEAPAVSTIVWVTNGRATEMDVCQEHEDVIRADYYELQQDQE